MVLHSVLFSVKAGPFVSLEKLSRVQDVVEEGISRSDKGQCSRQVTKISSKE